MRESSLVDYSSRSYSWRKEFNNEDSFVGFWNRLKIKCFGKSSARVDISFSKIKFDFFTWIQSCWVMYNYNQKLEQKAFKTILNIIFFNIKNTIKINVMIKLSLVLNVVILRKEIEDLHKHFINVFKPHRKLNRLILCKHTFVLLENFNFFWRIDLSDFFRAERLRYIRNILVSWVKSCLS